MTSERIIIAGLDIGSAKTTAVIGQAVPTDGKNASYLRILGVGQARTTGLRRGIVSDIEETTRSIKKAIEDAERMAGVKVDSIHVGIAGEHVRAMISKGIVAVNGDEISKADVDRANEVARAQPVPQLNFNEQTATAVFGGFQDKKFGNTLVVKPSVNKDNFITLAVKPEISNKVADQPFTFAGATVTSPVIDTRSLDSNVLIKSGDTLAIGGLLQDEVTKARTKVPVLGDIPVLGYFFQEKLNARVKRNLLVFVTPTIIDQHYGTGLEDQVSGLRHVGEEYADPNGWRNNAKGAVRLVPTSNRHVAADYPKPGTPPAPARTESETTETTTKSIDFKTSANERGF